MATERNTPPEQQQPSFERPPKKSLTPWVLLLPAALLIGVLWQSWRQPEQPVQPIMDNAVTPSTPKLTPTTKPIGGNEKLSDKLTIFVPNDDAMLHPKVVSDPSLRTISAQDRSNEAREKAATAALQLLFENSKGFFPAGTRLTQPVSYNGGRAHVSLSKEFAATSQSWSSAESLLYVYSIVNTVVASKSQLPAGSDDDAVQLLIEGKPVAALGALDVSKQLEPNTELVAGS